jgi:hypothetical protein
MNFESFCKTSFSQQPFLIFLLSGLSIFFLDHMLNDSWSQPEPLQKSIEITAGLQTQLRLKFEKVWQRAPTKEETQGYLEDFIRSQILADAAQELGLDRSDEVVTRRLRQKMALVFRATAGHQAPTGDVLESFFKDHRADYLVPPSYDIEQIYLGPSASASEVKTALNRIQSQPDWQPPHHAIGIPMALGMQSQTQISKRLGRVFVDGLEALPLQQWVGPIQSGYGTHLVRLKARVPARLPELADVKTQVIEDWTAMQREQAVEHGYQRLRATYQISYLTSEQP